MAESQRSNFSKAEYYKPEKPKGRINNKAKSIVFDTLSYSFISKREILTPVKI